MGPVEKNGKVKPTGKNHNATDKAEQMVKVFETSVFIPFTKDSKLK